MGKINLSGYVDSSIVDGDGVRFAVYTQGCKHHCPGCHNPDTWNFKKNKEFLIADLVDIIEDNALTKNVTISGGDPLFQLESTIELCESLKALGYNIWLYTGYTLEQIEEDTKLRQILKVIDILVEGRFEQSLKDFNLKCRGSSNQRIINCNKL